MDTYKFASNAQNYREPSVSNELIKDRAGNKIGHAIVSLVFNGFGLSFKRSNHRLEYRHIKPVDEDLAFLDSNIKLTNWAENIFMGGYFFPKGVDPGIDKARDLLDESRDEYNKKSGSTPAQVTYLPKDGFIPKSLALESQDIIDFPYKTLDEILKDEGRVAIESAGVAVLSMLQNFKDLDQLFQRFNKLT